jgi:beta-xylosidase
MSTQRLAPVVLQFLIVVLLGSWCSSNSAHAQVSQQWGTWQHWGDQRDGTYRNPVLPGDFSDIDAIRVGADYYAISSTLHLSPGMLVLQSKDLVNWTLLTHVVTDMTTLSPEYGWDRAPRLGRGVWAGSIRYHAGRFWVFFGTPDEGFFMSTAADPAGPWTAPHSLLSEAGWDDCSALWDEDGQAYFVGTKFADGYKTYVFRMAPDGRSIDRASAVLVNEGQGREANKLLKVDGWYYLIFSEHDPKKGRYVLARRARHPMGPYQEVRQLAHPSREAFEPNQGGIVQTAGGEWFFFTHHGRSGWEGRAASLLPVTWKEGWPILGTVMPDGLGSMVWSGRKPRVDTSVVYPQSSDDFSSRTLGAQWEWNRQPRADYWSLGERAGWLRLKAWRPLQAGNPVSAGNLISQRSFRTAANAAVLKIDVSGLAAGQRAGLIHFADTYAALVVRDFGGRRAFEYIDSGATLAGPSVEQAIVWLRSRWGLDGQVVFEYSLDGRSYRQLGTSYQQKHAHYRGARVGIVNFNEAADRGWVDVDSFSYAYAPGQ